MPAGLPNRRAFELGEALCGWGPRRSGSMGTANTSKPSDDQEFVSVGDYIFCLEEASGDKKKMAELLSSAAYAFDEDLFREVAAAASKLGLTELEIGRAEAAGLRMRRHRGNSYTNDNNAKGGAKPNGGIGQNADGSLGESPDPGAGKQKDQLRFKLVDFDSLRARRSKQYLIKGLLPSKGLCVVWGPPKCGKSFWMMTTLLHVALGWEYRGRRVAQGSVVYLALEGQDGFNERASAFRKRYLTDGEKVPRFKL